jgi:hypothetical protein
MISFDTQQGWIFWLATTLNVFSEMPFALMPKVIRPLIRRVAKEVVSVEQKRKVTNCREDAELVENKVEALGGNKMFGSTIGLVERQLYLYGLVFNLPAVITGVLVFKGFNAWLQADTKPPDRSEIRIPKRSENESQPDAARPTCAERTESPAPTRPGTTPPLAKRHEMLVNYYSYTLGNLTSIAFALLLFHITKAVVVFAVQGMKLSDIPRIVFGLLAPIWR